MMGAAGIDGGGCGALHAVITALTDLRNLKTKHSSGSHIKNRKHRAKWVEPGIKSRIRIITETPRERMEKGAEGQGHRGESTELSGLLESRL